MKKILSVILVMSLTAGLIAGCGKKIPQPKTIDIEAEKEETSSYESKEDKSSDESSPSSSADGTKWTLACYTSGDNVIKGSQLASFGMEDFATLVLNDDGTGVFTMSGSDMDITYDDNGDVYMSGSKIYSFKYVDDDTIDFDAAGSTLTFVREGSSAAASIGDPDAGDSDVIADAEERNKAPFKMRDPIAGEEVMDVDGGTIYYQLFSDGAEITYGYLNTKEFKVPTEIEGKKVYSVRKLHGHIENLYLPNAVRGLSSDFGDFEGLETLNIGYDEGESQFKYFKQCGCKKGHFDRTNLREINFPESMKENEDFGVGSAILVGAPKLTTINNMPPVWTDGVKSLEAAQKMMKDPSKCISPQSAKVTALAKEVTKDCSTDEEKLFEICRWVVDNVSYDMKGFWEYSSQKYAEYYGKEYDGDPDPVKWLEPDEVIDHKLTVCSGYSKLTKAMCNAVGIPCCYVTGPITEMDDAINLHAWNMVYINGEWQFIDNTWSDSDYNSTVFEDDYEHADTAGQISYETWVSNEELREAYSWEDIEAINKQTVERESFDGKHAYYLMPPLVMGADHTAREVDGIPVTYEGKRN